MDSFAWAHQQFWGAPLPDLRLVRRLVEVAASIRRNPCGTLPRAILGKASLKGAYRLFSHPEVGHEQILRTHAEQTRDRCREPGQYLLIEDTTALSFTQRGAIAGMGPLTDESSQGILVHTCLGTRIEQWDAQGRPEVTLTGVFGQECWVREKPEGTRLQRKKAKRKTAATASLPRESDRWGRALEHSGGPPPKSHWTLVADRECDIFEVMARCKEAGADWIIRASQARNTESGKDVFEVVAMAPVLTTYTVPLRARRGVAARDARVEVRATVQTLRPPAGLRSRHDGIETGLVEVREIEPPEGVEGIYWLLLTSWPCAKRDEARRATQGYTCRWLIEEYHKALKTGTHIEDSQLSTKDRIEALVAIHAVIAVDLVNLKLLANSRPDDTIDEAQLVPEGLAILELKYGRPAQGWTNRMLMNAIARMGGYLGRKNDGPPGWLSIWRGWLKLTLMTEGYLLAAQHQSYG